MTPDNPAKTSEKPEKNEKGQWLKGVSGNPAGRPKRKETQAQINARNMLYEYAPFVTENVLMKALDGNMDALKMCFERLHPKAKEAPLTIDLPAINSAEGALEALAFLADSAARGDLTLSEAERLSGMVNKYLEHSHLPHLQNRLDKVERWIDANTLSDNASQ